MTKMRIMVLSDEPCLVLSDAYRPEVLEGIDVIVSCGDLPYDYLSFIATVFRGPVLYVHGNHDAKYKYKPPLGCLSIEDRIYTYKGVRFLGLGGSHRYNGVEWQFTQKEMDKRVRKLWFELCKSKGFDVLVTHSPAFGHYDGADPAHTGFKVFNDLIERYKPKLFLYGHVHLSYGSRPREFVIGNTRCINGYERYIIDLETDD
ncbi:metallophosphoesterase [uncultured Dubosiella sp.]|uniref:metallophosphoesterase family protein n=1 Tax=uncultured Dubosiella sp. TaxID=1937011 RepID=UPI0025F33B8A|nr:metallophosphoesterase [uncultured Dubosiella sp.]